MKRKLLPVLLSITISLGLFSMPVDAAVNGLLEKISGGGEEPTATVPDTYTDLYLEEYIGEVLPSYMIKVTAPKTCKFTNGSESGTTGYRASLGYVDIVKTSDGIIDADLYLSNHPLSFTSPTNTTPSSGGSGGSNTNPPGYDLNVKNSLSDLFTITAYAADNSYLNGLLSLVASSDTSQVNTDESHSMGSLLGIMQYTNYDAMLVESLPANNQGEVDSNYFSLAVKQKELLNRNFEELYADVADNPDKVNFYSKFYSKFSRSALCHYLNLSDAEWQEEWDSLDSYTQYHIYNDDIENYKRETISRYLTNNGIHTDESCTNYTSSDNYIKYSILSGNLLGGNFYGSNALDVVESSEIIPIDLAHPSPSALYYLFDKNSGLTSDELDALSEDEYETLADSWIQEHYGISDMNEYAESYQYPSAEVLPDMNDDNFRNMVEDGYANYMIENHPDIDSSSKQYFRYMNDYMDDYLVSNYGITSYDLYTITSGAPDIGGGTHIGTLEPDKESACINADLFNSSVHINSNALDGITDEALFNYIFDANSPINDENSEIYNKILQARMSLNPTELRKVNSSLSNTYSFYKSLGITFSDIALDKDSDEYKKANRYYYTIYSALQSDAEGDVFGTDNKIYLTTRSQASLLVNTNSGSSGTLTPVNPGTGVLPRPPIGSD